MVCALQGNSSQASVVAAYGYGANGLVQRFASGNYTAYTFDPRGNLVCRYRQQDAGTTAYDLNIFDAFGLLVSCVNPYNANTLTPLDEVGFGGQWGYYTDRETCGGDSA